MADHPTPEITETDNRLSLHPAPALPALQGEVSAHANPVDVYVSGKSPHTRRMVRSHMDKVAKLFGYAGYRQAPWAALRFHHVQQLIGVLNESGLAPKTVNAILSAIRGTAKAAFNLYQLAGDDLQRIMNVGLVRGTRLKRGRIVPAGELSSLVNACLEDKGPAGIRDIALIGVLYICGLRRAEAVSLRVSDLNIGEKALRVLGKGNKERRVFPDAGTLAACADWLTARGRHEGALFNRVLKGGRIVPGPLTDQAVYVMLDKRWRQAGVPPLAPHDFRRTFISTLLSKGVDMLTVQRMAGHCDPRTTSGYDLRPESEMRAAAALLHLPYHT
jgi:site-specific recombinase XerD